MAYFLNIIYDSWSLICSSHITTHWSCYPISFRGWCYLLQFVDDKCYLLKHGTWRLMLWLTIWWYCYNCYIFDIICVQIKMVDALIIIISPLQNVLIFSANNSPFYILVLNIQYICLKIYTNIYYIKRTSGMLRSASLLEIGAKLVLLALGSCFERLPHSHSQ